MPLFGVGTPEILLLLILGWSVLWKGIALWQAARRDQLGWYIVLLIINTAGILPIIYIFAVAPRHPELGAPTRTTTAEA